MTLQRKACKLAGVEIQGKLRAGIAAIDAGHVKLYWTIGTYSLDPVELGRGGAGKLRVRASCVSRGIYVYVV